jgi:hypothetical protein
MPLRVPNFMIVLLLVGFLLPASSAPARSESPPQTLSTLKVMEKTTSGCGITTYVSGIPKLIGSFFTSSAITWTGSCVDGLVSGVGVLESTNLTGKTHYEGGMRAGKMNGHGTVNLPDGSSMSGEFTDGMVDGEVVYVSPKGVRYEGGWHDGMREGHAIVTSPDGSRYEGYWHHDNLSGSGVLTWPSGIKYAGEFLHGKRNGHGTLSFPSGGHVDGEWKDGELVGNV